ncbi:MAG: hypothetical protein ACREK6_22150 [Candidatus Rokuibacteriota bacterium]
MGQVLVREGVGKLDVDRAFIDGGELPSYALQGGLKVLVRAGTTAKPEIYQRGKSFFYGDGNPVINEKDVEHLPTKCQINGEIVDVRAMAQEFVRKQQAPVVTPKGKAKGGVRILGADNPKKIRAPQHRGRHQLVKGSELIGQRGPERVTDPDQSEE